MSRPRYWWYGVVCRIIGQYPDLCQRIGDLRGQQITARYNANGASSGSSGRSLEDAVMRYVSTREYADYEAVSKAIEIMSFSKDGERILSVVREHSWGSRSCFEWIAEKEHMSVGTAKNLHRKFVYEVARQLGYTKSV